MPQPESAALRLMADCCRKQARGASRPGVAACLQEMAVEYELKADDADAAARLQVPRPRQG
jgi:hypothetical protein